MCNLPVRIMVRQECPLYDINYILSIDNPLKDSSDSSSTDEPTTIVQASDEVSALSSPEYEPTMPAPNEGKDNTNPDAMTEAAVSDEETIPDQSTVDNILANSDLFDAGEPSQTETSPENDWITLNLLKPKKMELERRLFLNNLTNSTFFDVGEESLSEKSTEISSRNSEKSIEKKVKVDTVLKQIETDDATDDGGPQQKWTQRVHDIRQYFDEWVKNLSEQRKNKLPKMADNDGPEAPESNEETERQLNSFDLSFGSSLGDEFEILNGDSIFQNGQRIFIHKISATRFIGMKQIPNTGQYAPIEISFNKEISFELVRVNLEYISP